MGDWVRKEELELMIADREVCAIYWEDVVEYHLEDCTAEDGWVAILEVRTQDVQVIGEFDLPTPEAAAEFSALLGRAVAEMMRLRAGLPIMPPAELAS